MSAPAKRYALQAGASGELAFARIIAADGAGIRTAGLLIGDREVPVDGREFSFRLRVLTGEPPRGLRREDAPEIVTEEAFSDTDRLHVSDTYRPEEAGGWSEPIAVDGSGCLVSRYDAEEGAGGVMRHAFELAGWPQTAEAGLGGLIVRMRYETHAADPVIRKNVEVVNGSGVWIKLESFLIDDISLPFADMERLTPAERGAEASVVSWGDRSQRRGVIVCSEVPSALRKMTGSGGTGYSGEWFEWVLAPGESFVSEAVFQFAYAGDVYETGAGVSRPLDRAVESRFVPFLRRVLGAAAAPVEELAPLWCSWSNFNVNLNDAVVREQALLAARAGFRGVLLDMGWARGGLGTEPDPAKFPDFRGTCAFIRSLGLKLGLWVSCYRDDASPDMAAVPDGPSVPLLRRHGGYGMSFAGPWRDYYAEDLARAAKEYGVSYFKQDFTNIQFGDIAEGHESRTRKESLLRGLRGLLAAQRRIAELTGGLRHAGERSRAESGSAPENGDSGGTGRGGAGGVVAEITHELYWGTPGVPCDVAALRSAGMFHIPPNDYSGVGDRRRRVDASWRYDPGALRAELLRGCHNARQRFYAHRGLPLAALSYYGAHTVNVRGSLTQDVQDRQICSWLMGAPLIFAGDLASLTEEHIAHYRRRFDLVARLQREYGIFGVFQFSGVPAPTDEDWHWWGKLNGEGAGAVVVLRGSGGAQRRSIVVPWAKEDVTYRVYAHFRGEALGALSGKELRAGAVDLALPPMGQELLELAIRKEDVR